jgi:hypothetical protein
LLGQLAGLRLGFKGIQRGFRANRARRGINLLRHRMGRKHDRLGKSNNGPQPSHHQQRRCDRELDR